MTCDVASERVEGSTSRSSAAITSGTSRRNPVITTWLASPRAWTRRCTSSKPTPSPTITKRAAGTWRRTMSAASRKSLWPFDPRMLATSPMAGPLRPSSARTVLPLTPELGLNGPAIGLVANIRGSKGHNDFLDAALIVRRHVPAARFVIVGDGVGFDDVHRRVHALGLANHVVMTGFRRDVPEVMAALDLLVLPSTRSEATSQVIPQALAVRTPVVATAVGGIPEIVKDGVTGRLVPPGEPDALARAILEMISDTERAHIMAQA